MAKVLKVLKFLVLAFVALFLLIGVVMLFGQNLRDLLFGPQPERQEYLPSNRADRSKTRAAPSH